jgi:hypothetical protein
MNYQEQKRAKQGIDAMPDDIFLPCLACGKIHKLPENSLEAQGILNVFCNGECEDRYAFRQ